MSLNAATQEWQIVRDGKVIASISISSQPEAILAWFREILRQDVEASKYNKARSETR